MTKELLSATMLITKTIGRIVASRDIAFMKDNTKDNAIAGLMVSEAKDSWLQVLDFLSEAEELQPKGEGE